MKFSIIMSAYHPLALLPHAVECVLRQTYTNWELLIVLDGVELPMELDHGCHDKIHLIRNPRHQNSHGNEARGAGVRHATGDYVVWINHDALIDPHYLEEHAANITKERPRPIISVVSIRYWLGWKYTGQMPVGECCENARSDQMNWAVPRELAEEVSAYLGRNLHRFDADWHVFNDIRNRGTKVVVSPRVCGTHF